MDLTTISLPDPVQLAIPAFALLCIAEALFLWWRGRPEHELRDSAASLAMGLGNVVIGALSGIGIGAFMVWLYQFRLFDIGYAWWAFVLVFFADDLAYYWFHRLSHERRLFWAAHVTHHSSQHYNLTTALRQSWTGWAAGTFLFWAPLALVGFPPALIAFQKGISLLYQFWIHTEAIRTLGPLEKLLNTPSHHRVHHARNARYLDANYAGILIIWDRLFGTYIPEDRNDPPRYGLVHNLNSFNPLVIAFHEWAGMLRDVARARNWRERWGYVFGPPGWSPDGSRLTSADLKRKWQARSPAAMAPAEPAE